MRLISQMEAGVTSPAQNIAEGEGRQYKKEFIQFLHIAQGSVFEVVTLNEIFRRRTLFSEEEANEIRKRCEQIHRKLNGLINSLHGKRTDSSKLILPQTLSDSGPVSSNYETCLPPTLSVAILKPHERSKPQTSVIRVFTSNLKRSDPLT